MKRISVWLMATLSAGVLLVGYHTSTAGPLATGTSTSVVSGSTAGTVTPSPSPSASPSASASTGTKKKKATATTSTVTGQVAQTQWGPVQVQLSITGGRISKVSVLQYPNGNGRDAQINSYALPILIQETQQKQSANIDMVSGATVTSDGYLQSLQSALDQAHL